MMWAWNFLVFGRDLLAEYWYRSDSQCAAVKAAAVGVGGVRKCLMLSRACGGPFMNSPKF